MNGNPHDQHEKQHETPDRRHEQSEPVEKTGTPDAVEAAHVRRDGGVGPTDLIAGPSASLSGRGTDFEAELARRARAPIANRMHDLADRARRLPPLSAFGRSGATHESPVRSGVGMNR